MDSLFSCPLKKTLLPLALIVGFVNSCLSKPAAGAEALNPARSGGTIVSKTKETMITDPARQLVAKILTAYGGYEKLKAFNEAASRSRAKVQLFSTISGAVNSFEGEILSKGEKMRTEIVVMGQPVITAYNGKTCWTQQGTQVFPTDPTTAKHVEEEIKHGLLLLLKLNDPKRKIELGTRKAIEGRLCNALKVTADDGRPATFYTDPKTHLVVRSEYLGTNLETGLETAKIFDYSDYRPIVGTMMPYKIIEYNGQKKASETNLLAFEPNITLDESVFDMPTEKKIEKAITVPFEYIANEIIVKAKVNGNQEYRFVVDTGATQSVLDSATAKILGGSKESDYSMTTGSGSVKMNYANLTSFEIGDLRLENFPIAVTDMTLFSQFPGEKPAGLLGANVLRRYAVTVDYQDKTLILSDPNNVEIPAGAAVIKTKPTLDMFGVAVEGVLDGKKKLTFLVDTGAAFNNISEPLIKCFVNGPLLPVGAVQGLDGRNVKTASVKFKTLALGHYVVANPVFTVAPSNTTPNLAGLITTGSIAILGNPFWNRFRMTLDYRHERLILSQSAEERILCQTRERINEINYQLLKDKNTQAAVRLLRDLVSKVHKDNTTAAEALALAALASALAHVTESTTGPPYTSKAEELQAAGRELEKALQLVEQSHNQAVEAIVASQAAIILLNNANSQQSINSIRRLLKVAANANPMDSTLSFATSMFLSQLGNSGVANQALDQALMSDPSNWQALWAKYRQTKNQNNKKMEQIVAAQLSRYYPDVPEVIALNKKIRSSGATIGGSTGR